MASGHGTCRKNRPHRWQLRPAVQKKIRKPLPTASRPQMALRSPPGRWCRVHSLGSESGPWGDLRRRNLAMAMPFRPLSGALSAREGRPGVQRSDPLQPQRRHGRIRNGLFVDDLRNKTRSCDYRLAKVDWWRCFVDQQGSVLCCDTN